MDKSVGYAGHKATDTSTLNDTVADAFKLAGLPMEGCIEQAQITLNDTVADAFKLAGLPMEGCIEQAQIITFEAVENNILEVSTLNEATVCTADCTELSKAETNNILEADTLSFREQTQDIAVEDSILEVTTTVDDIDIQDTIIVIVPQESEIEEQLNELHEQEAFTSIGDEGCFTHSNCNKKFTDRKRFEEQNCSKVIELDEFLCKECGKVCIDNDNLKTHASMHLKQKAEGMTRKLFACKECKKVFQHKWSCENHSCHSKRFICEYCGRCYGRKGDMKRHIASEHTENKQYPCKSCDKTFATKWYLTQHEQAHIRGKAFQCQICGKRYSQKCHLKRHKFVHSKDSVKCKHCSKFFVNNFELSLHNCKHTQDQQLLRFTCHICAKTFSRKNDLKRHQFLHTGIKPFPCSYCEKSFVTSSHLKNHERSHTGEKPYHCHCGKQFKQKSHLVNHKISHASQVFRCKHCKKKFIEKESLSRHENIHLKVKNPKSQVNVEPGLDTALHCMLGFSKEESTDNNSKIMSVLNTTVDISSGEKEKATYLSNNGTNDIVPQQFATETFSSVHGEEGEAKNVHCSGNSIEEANNLHLQSEKPDENNTEKMHKCKYCKCVYKFRTRLLKHYMTHTAFHFDTDSSLLSHEQTEYLNTASGMELFTCCPCYRTYSNENRRNEHQHNCRLHVENNDHDLNQTLVVDYPSNGLSNENYICKVCNKVFLIREKYHQHMIYHTRRSFSNVIFNSGDLPVKISDLKLCFVCSYCSKEFVYKTCFHRHEKQHKIYLGKSYKPKPTHLHVCEKCGKDFRRIAHLKRHMQLHQERKIISDQNKLLVLKKTKNVTKEQLVHSITSSKLSATTCETSPLQDGVVTSAPRTSNRPVRKCNKPNRYRSDVDLQSGVETVADLTCDSTKHANKTQAFAIRDINTKLKNLSLSKSFDCKKCKKKFLSKHLLNRHLKKDPMRHLTCRMCCRRFSVLESLKRHEAGHVGNFLLSCKECGKGFSHQPTLEIHMQKHTGNKKHMCHVCGKMFVTKYNLKVHGYIHSGDSPNVCTLCGKHYGRKNDLRRHQLSHEGSQPFSCSFCDRKFISRWHLRYHEQTHANKKPC